MDILILLGGFTVLCALGVPVAYALGLSALLGALWTDIPLEAVMLRISDGTDDFVLLAIPFFVLAGGIMAEGRHGGAPGDARQGVRRLHPRRHGGGERARQHPVRLHLGLVGRRHLGDRLGDDSADGEAGLHAVFATNVTICGSVQALLIPPSHNAVIYSVAAGGTISVASLFLAGVFPGLLFGVCLIGLVLWTAHRRNMPKSEPIPLQDVPRIVLEALWGLVTIVIIIGGILSGVFTPPSPPRSRASTRSSSPSSSTATTSGATCRTCCTAW
jgi:TRAP-type mannitol/chloroaromatic compound transport system permease large subunit